MGRAEFKTFIRAAWRRFDDEHGRTASQVQFAEWLDITPELISRYMRGLNAPSGKNLEKIADKLGPGVYDALGIPRRMPSRQRHPHLEYILSDWHELTPEEEEELREHFNRILERKREKARRQLEQQGKFEV